MENYQVLEQRYTAVRSILEYGVYHVVQQLSIEGFTSPEPLPFLKRRSGKHKVYHPGDAWGRLFDCGWFHFTGSYPITTSSHLAVLVDLSAEGLLVDREGNPVQGLTSATSRNEFPLGLWGKRTIEAKDCLNEKGEIDFWCDFTCMDVEGQYKNGGRVKEACLCEIDEEARACFYDWVVCQSLFVGLCENQDPYGREVGAVLSEAAGCVECWQEESAQQGRQPERGSHPAYGMKDAVLPAEGITVLADPETNPTEKQQLFLPEDLVKKVRALLSRILQKPREKTALTYSSIGHSHLDLLFLWPPRETPRKCVRTLSTVMKMMDRYPDYLFSLSQVPEFEWIKQESPALYQRMLERVREGRLEPVGAFFIECDTNLPCGESLVRQLLYGKRYFAKEFGKDMKIGFLPDAFGYSAALPQLLVKAGVPYFMTNKLSMNDTNRFPHCTFWWEGLDGSAVLAHMPPENTYTSACVPQVSIYGERHDPDLAVCPYGLELYGLGDGGGGPGYEHMERRKRLRDLKGTPAFRDETVLEFFRRIEKNGDHYARWRGELYLERHQGTYTSIARQKKWNRTLEEDLHQLEAISVLSQAQGGPAYPARWLEKAWKEVLLFQFHDCLPGSAIERVYRETQARYQALHRSACNMIRTRLSYLAKQLDTTGMSMPALLFNPAGIRRTDRIVAKGYEKRVALEPYEVKITDLSQGVPCKAVPHDDPLVLENRLVRFRFAKDGTLSEICDKISGRELLPEGKSGGKLLLYPDKNTHWDIEKNYWQREPEQAKLLSFRRRDTALCKRLFLRFSVGRSDISQVVSLEEESARCDFQTRVDWKEEYQMLRVSFPTSVSCASASCEIQFGHLERPVTRNTSWEEAKFEVPCQRFADMHDNAGGVALLNDCKYGYKIWDRTLDLNLLRSQNIPCEKGDVGIHEFTYAVYPHDGDVWQGGVVREGYKLCQPIAVLPLSTETVCRKQERSYVPVSVIHGSVVADTLKKAEDSDVFVIRFYEAAGGEGWAQIQLQGFEALSLCDLMEQPAISDDLEILPDQIRIHFRPFEVQSLLVRRKNV